MTMITFHQGLTAEEWHTRSLMDQLGNIGSEVGRALTALENGNTKRKDAALDRGLELFDWTLSDPKNRTRLKELCRAREVVCDFFFGDCEYKSTPESLNKYFLPFAVAARQQQ